MPSCNSCGAAIRFAQTETGKTMPIDEEPVANGNLVLLTLQPGEIPQVRYLKKGEEPPLLAPRYVSHFATCPDRQDWRGKRRG